MSGGVRFRWQVILIVTRKRSVSPLWSPKSWEPKPARHQASAAVGLIYSDVNQAERSHNSALCTNTNLALKTVHGMVFLLAGPSIFMTNMQTRSSYAEPGS